MAAKKKASKGAAKGGAKPGTFICPECDFKAKHAMGLGRHRSSRHGVLSLRAKREGGSRSKAAPAAKQSKAKAPATPRGVAAPPSGWLTRRQAAAVAGIHYNTVRIWERSKLVRTKARGRETLVNEADLRRVAKQKSSSNGAAAPAARAASRSVAAAPSVEVRADDFTRAIGNALADALEQLAVQVRPPKRRGRPPKAR